MKKLATTALIALLPLTALPAMAADEVNVAPGLSTAGAPLALHGADPVALLNGGGAVTGKAELASVHDGVAYYFSTEANQKAFEASPETFAAQNGGYCSYGVVVGKKFDGDPRFYTVHDNKLYVFLNAATRDKWLEDVDGSLKTSEANWMKIEHIAASEL